MSWENSIKDFKSYLQIERSLSENSIQAYIRDIKKFANYAIPLKLNELVITRKHISDFLTKLKEKNISARSQARIISGIKAFYKYLIMEDYIKINPTELIESPKIGTKLPDTLSLIEIDRLIAAIDLSNSQGERNRAIIETLYSCGLRVSELCDLNLSDIDLSDCSARVIGGKGDKDRLVLFTKTTVENIHAWLPLREGRQPVGDNLLITNAGTALQSRTVQRLMDRLADQAGIPRGRVSPHVLRHNFATGLLERGADLVSIQRLLGHASIATTRVYLEISDQTLREVYRRAQDSTQDEQL